MAGAAALGVAVGADTCWGRDGGGARYLDTVAAVHPRGGASLPPLAPLDPSSSHPRTRFFIKSLFNHFFRLQMEI